MYFRRSYELSHRGSTRPHATHASLSAAQLVDSGQAPVDRRLAVLAQVLVRARKVPATVEAAVRGKRRRVRRLEDTMTPGVDQFALRLRVTAPEQEHEAFALAVERVDAGVGETLPPFALMRASETTLDGQDGVEQQHALARPRNQ